MLSRFFIDRPIFASVLSIVITLVGAIAAFTLPVAQYPEIAPPTVQVSCVYPGANAKVVAETIASPIEEQVNGVEDMMYMSSQSTNDGSYTLTITFKVGTDLDMAQVRVQNRVAIAQPLLPEAVRQTGVLTQKRSPSILLVVNLFSPDGRYDQLYLSNYAAIQVRDELARVQGVGDVFFLGRKDYSMRVWLDPEKLAANSMTTLDVVAALREQNVQVAAGQIGQPPAPPGQDFQYIINTLGRLIDTDQFAQIILKSGDKGEVTRVRDVARVELGARNQDIACTLDGKPTVGLAMFQLPGSNALETADHIRARMEDLKKYFPEGLDYSIVYDTTPFVRESIREVFKSLIEAVILVAIVVLVFLQNWRSALIPLIAVPVSLIGTFAVMKLLGFSLNNLSLFGMVLAIGIVVDDAIVVVENVERWIHRGLSPREASYKSMNEVTVAVIAIAFGLSAVFIPTAFVSGITGQFYRQFALTIATSTLISAFNSLTLSPALTALFLPARGAKPDWFTRMMNAILGWFFRLFNTLFAITTERYARIVRRCLRLSAVCLLIYAGLLVLTHWSFKSVPTGFIPSQDKGYLLANVQLPDSASLERTQAVLARIEKIAREIPGVKHSVGVAGQSFLLGVNGSNLGSMFAVLDEFDNRHDPAKGSEAIIATLRDRCFHEVQEAIVAVFGAPAVDGLGNAGGFKIMIQDRSDLGMETLQQQTENFVTRANATPGLVGVFSGMRADTPQLYADVDRTKCKMLGVNISDVFNTMQVFLGGYYVNDFNRFGRTWQVNVQADSKFRLHPDNIGQLKVRNASGEMIPLSTLIKVRDVGGPIVMQRYNMYPAAAVNGATLPGFSSNDSVRSLEALAAAELPRGMGYEWTELSYLENLSGNTIFLIFPLCVLFVFLTHSAEYESWALPLAIILIVPMGILCSLLGVWARGMDNNILTQIGFVVLAGLACKNAVLIVEFAKQREEEDKRGPLEAAVESCRLRLRPILMTSFAFILGVVPLTFATGAGAEMRRTLGTAVFSGMLGVTLIGLILTPVFYYVIRRVVIRIRGDQHAVHDETEAFS